MRGGDHMSDWPRPVIQALVISHQQLGARGAWLLLVGAHNLHPQIAAARSVVRRASQEAVPPPSDPNAHEWDATAGKQSEVTSDEWVRLMAMPGGPTMLGWLRGARAQRGWVAWGKGPEWLAAH